MDGHLIKQVPSLLFLLRMTEIVTTWIERRIGAQILKPNWPMADRQPESAAQSHLPLCFPPNSTPILVWVQTSYISSAKQQSKRERLPQGYVIIYLTYPATSTTVLWLIHFLSTKNDYAFHSFIKSNRPLSFLYAISISNLMYQFKRYTTQLNRKMPYQNI